MKAKKLMLLTGVTTLFLSVATLNGSLKAQNSTSTTPGGDTTNTTQCQISPRRFPKLLAEANAPTADRSAEFNSGSVGLIKRGEG